MRLELTGRHVSITPAMRALVAQRLSRLHRVLNDSAVSAQITVSREKAGPHAEITLHARGEHFLHGAATGRNALIALGAGLDKIDSQAQKLKGKWSSRKRRGPSPPVPATPTADKAPDVRIIRARRYAVKELAVEDAARDVGPERDQFVVFRNAASDTINVLYRRPDGNLGLIEPES